MNIHHKVHLPAQSVPLFRINVIDKITSSNFLMVAGGNVPGRERESYLHYLVSGGSLLNTSREVELKSPLKLVTIGSLILSSGNMTGSRRRIQN